MTALSAAICVMSVTGGAFEPEQARLMSPDLACTRTALAQNGVLSRGQALAHGMSPDSIFRRLQSGRWEEVLPGVYRLTGSPRSWMQRLTAAMLWAGESALVSGRSAGALWGLDECPEGPVELTLTVRRCRAPSGIRMRCTQKLAACDITTHRGLRITTVARTLLDLGAAFDDDRLELVLEDALRKRLTSIPRLRQLLGTSGHKLPGAKRLRKLVERRDPGQRPTDTRFEAKLFALLRKAKLPLPRPGVTVSNDGGFVARADFAYPAERLIIEAHSYRWHSGRKKMDNDIQREKKLRRVGWRVLYVTYEDLLERPHEIVEDIRSALANPQLFT